MRFLRRRWKTRSSRRYWIPTSRIWKKGDANNLHDLLFKSFKGYPEIKERLLDQRNKNWVLQIEGMTQENRNVLIIVGAGHLIGPGSVVEILKQKGYTVMQR